MHDPEVRTITRVSSSFHLSFENERLFHLSFKIDLHVRRTDSLFQVDRRTICPANEPVDRIM
jgi:hypothetical protein